VLDLVLLFGIRSGVDFSGSMTHIMGGVLVINPKYNGFFFCVLLWLGAVQYCSTLYGCLHMYRSHSPEQLRTGHFLVGKQAMNNAGKDTMISYDMGQVGWQGHKLSCKLENHLWNKENLIERLSPFIMK
jgi:hypothetical protein